MWDQREDVVGMRIERVSIIDGGQKMEEEFKIILNWGPIVMPHPSSLNPSQPYLCQPKFLFDSSRNYIHLIFHTSETQLNELG